MTAIVLEHNPWIVVVQPYEDYGLRRDVEFTASPDQQIELRRFNFRLNVRGAVPPGPRFDTRDAGAP
jgi:hypothetical protein